jgi:glycerol-3-phosphate dehydrogenase (NAD(P)+)
MGLGENARAALVTRGLSEMMRLGAAMGADPETLTGLAGMGDLVLTATGGLSRNRRLGLALGQGHHLKSAQEEIGQVVEGVYAAREVMTLAKRYDVELPIAQVVYAILFEDVTPVDGVKALLARDMRAEFD